MKKRAVLIASVLLVACQVLSAQPHFVTSGSIEFEKSVNSYAVIKRTIDSYKSYQTWYATQYAEFKKNQPQFKILKSSLSFSKDKTLFEPIPEEDDKYVVFISYNPLFKQNNIVYTDFSTKTLTNQKQVFEETFLMKENTRKIKWKLTEETREIAGYSCRRANGIMLDSVYVVAFYAESILVPGGPEFFSGLPGMILGVVLPHENVSWFATKVNEKPIPALKVPSKGKLTTTQELKAALELTGARDENLPTLTRAFLY